MDDQGRNKMPKWQKLVQGSQIRQQKSMHSKDSSRHERYTPNKHHSKSPQRKFNISAIKDKTTSMKNIKHIKEKSDIIEQSKSMINQTKSITSLLKRFNSIDRESSAFNLFDKQKVKWSNIIDNKNDEICTDQQLFEKNIQLQKMNNLNVYSSMTERSNKENKEKKEKKEKLIKPIEMPKLGRLDTEQKEQEEKQQVRDQQIIQETSHHDVQTIEGILQKFATLVKMLEENIINERNQIMKMLEQKHRHFLTVKQQIFKAFAKKQRQITNPQLRMLIDEYLPKKYDKLTRVTSQQLFNRLLVHGNNNKLQLGQHLIKKQIEPSIRSNASIMIKEGLNIIFSTLNEMKKNIDENQKNGYPYTGLSCKNLHNKIGGELEFKQDHISQSMIKKCNDLPLAESGLKTLKAQKKNKNFGSKSITRIDDKIQNKWINLFLSEMSIPKF